MAGSYFYTVFKRKLKGKNVYYLRILSEDGKRIKTVSTKQTAKGAAYRWAEAHYMEHIPAGLPGALNNPTLYEYAKDFFLWGKCDYIARQNAKDRSITPGTAAGRRGHLENYIFPQWGETRLVDLTAPEIERWLLHLKSVVKHKDGKKRDLANNSKNQIIYTLNAIFGEAERDGYITRAPNLEPFGKKRRKHRQPLTDGEIETMFPTDRRDFLEVWDEFYMGVLAETMLSTGMRSGEVRALWVSDILEEAKALRIFRQLHRDGTYGLPGRQRNPDKDPRRIALLPDRTLADLLEYLGDRPRDDSLVFTLNDSAIDQGYILKRIKRAAEKAGLGRDIDAHSLRYTYTSRMRELMITADVPDTVLQKLLGHSTPSTTDIYDPFLLDRAVKTALPSRPAIDSFWETDREQPA
jgi:integrase